MHNIFVLQYVYFMPLHVSSTKKAQKYLQIIILKPLINPTKIKKNSTTWEKQKQKKQIDKNINPKYKSISSVGRWFILCLYSFCLSG